MKIIKNNKLSLRELMSKKEFKNFRFLHLHIHDDWNSQKYMDNNHFKWLLDWKEKEYLGDENGNPVFDDVYYTNEYDDYIVWNAEPFNIEHLNLMLTPKKKNEIILVIILLKNQYFLIKYL